ncbi:MAG: toll/interleukin-1 receptor domain-containing protein [Treponema sp.]|nr:toll/interleukin-1 receptor domain-containing protein [Treponema sp.]
METIFDIINDSYEEKKKVYLDAFNKLQIEYDGIKKTIRHYTSEGLVTNYLNKLGSAIESKNAGNIEYCLKGILDWYNTNITDLTENGDLVDINLHKRNFELVENFYKIMSSTPNNCKVFTEQVGNKKTNIKNRETNDTIVFLSHSSSDKKYGDALRNFIVGLGVRNEQLIYTSHSLNKIPLDKNIYDYLRENFSKKVFMIILWSDEYLESPACLNEMGAAWVTQSDYTNIYVPSFNFGNPKYHECAVDTRKMGAVLRNDDNCKAHMIELKNKVL